MRLNEFAFTLLDADYIELVWDKENSRIRLRPLSQDKIYAGEISLPLATLRSYCISLTGFCHRHGIAYEETKTYRLEDYGHRIFAIDLRKPL